MKKITITLLLVLLAAAGFAQGSNVWMKKNAFGGSKRSRSVSFAIGSRGYIACGEDTADVMLNDLWEYDPGTDSWAQKASMPGVGRRDAACFVIGTRAFVGTGIDASESWNGNSLADMWMYDPTTNTWTARANFPGNGGFGMYFSTGFAVNGKGYFSCGKYNSSFYSNQLWEYNPNTNSWLQKANFPGGTRYAQSSFAIGNYGYVGFGTDENWFVNEFYRYDPALNVWQQLSSVPASPRFAASGFAIGNYGYFCFGTDGGYKEDLYEYEVATDNWWVKAPFGGQHRRSAAVFVIGGMAYAGTGKGFTGSRRDFWMYVPSYTGMDETSLQTSGMNVAPNPVDETTQITISTDLLQNEDHLRLEVYDLRGQLVRSEPVNASFTWHRNELAAGTYLLRLAADSKVFAPIKISIR